MMPVSDRWVPAFWRNILPPSSEWTECRSDDKPTVMDGGVFSDRDRLLSKIRMNTGTDQSNERPCCTRCEVPNRHITKESQYEEMSRKMKENCMIVIR
jgi:hypothetical protein